MTDVEGPVFNPISDMSRFVLYSQNETLFFRFMNDVQVFHILYVFNANRFSLLTHESCFRFDLSPQKKDTGSTRVYAGAETFTQKDFIAVLHLVRYKPP